VLEVFEAVVATRDVEQLLLGVEVQQPFILSFGLPLSSTHPSWNRLRSYGT